MEEKLSKKTKWGYSVSAIGRDAAYTLVSMYLLTYIQYTMQLTAAQYSVISAIMVVCLIWDAFNDPLMGIIIENCHFKMGKFKPWIITGAVINAIIIIILFTVRPTGWAFVAFFGLFYLLWGMTFTMNDISYWGMLPSLSSDPKTRDNLVTTMSVFCCVGQFLVAGIVPMVISGQAVSAFRIAALVIALGLIFFQTLCVCLVKEKERQENPNKLSLKDMFKVFFRNDQLVASGIAFWFFNIGNGLLITFGVNFFYFEFGYSNAGDLILVFTVMYGLGTLIAQALYALINKWFNRRKLMNISMIAIVVGYLLLMSFGYILPKNVILLDIIGFMIFFFQGVFNLCVVVMINNTIEYDEVKNHERHDSVVSSIRSFAVKLASAVNQGIVAIVLISSGIYNISQNISSLEIQIERGEIERSAALAQADAFTSSVESWQTLVLRIGMVAIPIIVIFVSYMILRKKYIITEEKYKELVEEIAARNQE